MNVVQTPFRGSFYTIQFSNFYIYYFRKFNQYPQKICTSNSYLPFLRFRRPHCCFLQQLTSPEEW